VEAPALEFDLPPCALAPPFDALLPPVPPLLSDESSPPQLTVTVNALNAAITTEPKSLDIA
jgi:hypothetical protein